MYYTINYADEYINKNIDYKYIMACADTYEVQA